MEKKGIEKDILLWLLIGLFFLIIALAFIVTDLRKGMESAVDNFFRLFG